jgi:uridine kinase
MDGIFLLRPDLIEYWDIRIFVMVDHEVALRRAINRDLRLFSSPELIIKRYRERYFPGQELYFQTIDPLSHVDVLVNNNTPEEPEVIFVNK